MHEKLSNKGEPVITPYYAYALDEYYFTNRWMNRISADCMMNNDSRIKSMFSCSLFKRIKNRYRKDMVALQESLTDLAEQDTSGFNTLHFRTDYHFKTASGKISMLTGTELNHETADGKRTGGKQSEYQAAVYATAEWQTLDKLRIMPGLRFNYFSNETFRLIPALSIRFDLTEQLFFRGNYSMGFRQPSPKEKFLDFQDVNHNISGNENLKPEISHNFTLSLQAEQQAGTFLISATPQFYYTTITNMITLAQVNNNDLLYSYINIGKYQTQGASFSLNAGHSKVAVGAGFSVNGVKDDVNNKMHYSPAANGNVLFKDEKNGLTAGLFIRWSGKSYVYTTGNTGLTSVRQEAFTMAEISVSKSFFKKRFEIQTGIKNLFDVKRVSATGTEGIHAAGNMPAGTGRSCFLKLTLSTGK
jgi:outer membrane receptor for ferrienterochelin and colicins